MTDLNNFPKSAVQFLNKLSKNNSKEWFEENRNLYNKSFLEPAQEFTIQMGEKLKKIAPEIMAIPKIDKSIFRIHRDVRFSKDKSPYKTNMGILLWEGSRKKIECSGFYFHIEPKMFLVGAGIYMMPKELMKPFRDAVADPEHGASLVKAIKKVEKIDGLKIYGEHYKKYPKGYDTSSEASKYLLYNGLHVMYESKNLKELYELDIVEYVFGWYKKMLPLHKWFLETLG